MLLLGRLNYSKNLFERVKASIKKDDGCVNKWQGYRQEESLARPELSDCYCSVICLSFLCESDLDTKSVLYILSLLCTTDSVYSRHICISWLHALQPQLRYMTFINMHRSPLLRTKHKLDRAFSYRLNQKNKLRKKKHWLQVQFP